MDISALSHSSSSCLLRAGRRAATPPCPTSCGAAFRGAPRTRPPLWPRQEASCWASPVTPPASRSTSPCSVTASAREAASRWPLKPTFRSPPRSRTWPPPVSQQGGGEREREVRVKEDSLGIMKCVGHQQFDRAEMFHHITKVRSC